MSAWLTLGVILLLAYLAGATPFGYLAGRWRGLDIRQHGSGNIGATNVIRVLGKGIGIPVFILDLLKGWLPVVGAVWWVSQAPAFTPHPLLQQLTPVLAGLAAVAGHMAPVWLGFKGGKGVATSAGIMIGLAPWPLLVALVTWIVARQIWRYVSLASILAGWALLLAVIGQSWWRGSFNGPLLGLCLVLTALVTVRHRSNLRRIAEGTEPKVGRKTAPASPSSSTPSA